MKSIAFWIVFSGMATLCGCAQSMIKPEDANPIYGVAPTNYKEQIHNHWNSTLKDPSSLQIKSIGAPEKARVYLATEKPHTYDLYSDVTFTPIYGHRVCTTVNAKNSFGAYAGWKTEMFFFDDKGVFAVPIVMPLDLLKGMHRTGSFAANSQITTDGCQ